MPGHKQVIRGGVLGGLLPPLGGLLPPLGGLLPPLGGLLPPGQAQV